MTDNSGRGYLPPTVPNPSNPHRRQWPMSSQGPPTFYPAPQTWQHTKPFLVLGSSSPQSEGIDLTARSGPPESAHNGGDPVNGQVKDVVAGVSVIASNPLVQPEEAKSGVSNEGIGSKAQFDRPTPVDFIAAETKMAFPSASAPASSATDIKGVPVHPSTSKPQDQPGIPLSPFEGNGPPAESEGTPSHPVESKVSSRPMKVAEPSVASAIPVVAPAIPSVAPVIPAVTPAIPTVAPNEPNQFNPGLPQDEPSLPPTVGPSLAPSSPPSPSAASSQLPKEPSFPSSQATSSTPKTSEPISIKQESSPSSKASPDTGTDHVESLLENMFQGGDESPLKQSVIVSNTKSPVLTDDKVVAILEDKSPVEPMEIKTEIKPDPDIKTQFMEVESELEKMFAGIVEPVPSSPAVPSLPSSIQNVSEPKKKKRPVPKPRIKKYGDSDSIVSKKRIKSKVDSDGKLKGVKRPRHEKIKEGSNDSSNVLLSKRGPYIYLEGTKESPTKICVVNSGSRDEEERDRTMDKVVGRRKLHVQIEGGEPAGDLFGPYILTIPQELQSESKDPKDSDIMAEQKKKGNGKQLSLRVAGVAEQFIKEMSKKGKKHQLPIEDYSGEREIWVHEKCATWAPGVFLVGPHLVGLAEAVSAASVTKCSFCSQFGASLGCVVRNCPVRCHYGCAVSTKWDLNYDTFIARCPNHTKQKS